MKRLFIAALCFCSLTIASLPDHRADAASKVGSAVHVFVGGDDGYHTYRIPALLTTSSGTVLAICEGRVDNQLDWGNIDLVMKRSTDHGTTWSDLQLIHDDGDNTIGNPAPVQDRDTGTIWLPFTWNNDKVFVTFSDDDGLTWAPPREITAAVKPEAWGWYATGPGHAIQLSSGRLLVPCDHREGGVPRSHVIYSDDHGRTWRLGGSAAPLTDEATAVELDDGAVMLNMRNLIRDRRFLTYRRAYAVSRDGGETFSETELAPELATPACEGSILRLPPRDGQGRGVIIFSGPASPFRSAMTLWLSRDDAATWSREVLVDPSPAAYSDLTVLPDGRAAILYENGPAWPYRRISFRTLDLL